MAGWLAEKITRSKMGLITNIILGMIGAAFGSLLFSNFGVQIGGPSVCLSRLQLRRRLHPHIVDPPHHAIPMALISRGPELSPQGPRSHHEDERGQHRTTMTPEMISANVVLANNDANSSIQMYSWMNGSGRRQHSVRRVRPHKAIKGSPRRARATTSAVASFATSAQLSASRISRSLSVSDGRMPMPEWRRRVGRPGKPRGRGTKIVHPTLGKVCRVEQNAQAELRSCFP